MSNRRSGTRDGVGGWPWMFRVMAALLGTLASVVCLELLLWTLPVYGGSRTLAVNDENPVIRFAPNREFVWSRDWNFSIVNKVRVNNYGFVSDFDYDENATGPLLAVIGDSFVEAFTEPFRKSCAGRLATKLDGTARVYAFGASGAPLSQYLAFAEYARDIFRPNGIVILVVKNDFDESLRKYAYRAGHHQFVERSDGRLVLARNDFDVGILHRLVRVSAVLRYLVGNVDVVRTGERIRRLLGGEEARGETEKEARARMLVTDSKRAVDAFLELLPESAGLDPARIAFVVDGMRPALYRDEDLKPATGGYLDELRRYFMTNAAARGYETLDMQPVFAAHYRAHRKRFEWPQDMHWNALGHEMCFNAVSRSALLSGGFPGLGELVAAGEGS